MYLHHFSYLRKIERCFLYKDRIQWQADQKWDSYICREMTLNFEETDTYYT